MCYSVSYDLFALHRSVIASDTSAARFERAHRPGEDFV